MNTSHALPTRIISQVLLILVALLWLFPFIWMLSTALKPAAAVFAAPPQLISGGLQWDNFSQAWNYIPFGRFMLNGLLVAGLGTLLVVASASLAAYAFARLRFPGRDKIFVLYLGTLIIPQEVIVVPMFILMKYFGWVDSYQALIVPWAFTAFGTLPVSLYDAMIRTVSAAIASCA